MMDLPRPPQEADNFLPEWVILNDTSMGMNVPGGCIIRYKESCMEFVPGVLIVRTDDPEHPVCLCSSLGQTVSTFLETMKKAMGDLMPPIPGFEPPKTS